MKIPELFATFGYRHQLVDLWEKQAQKSTRLRKLDNGLMISFVKPKYLAGRFYFAIRPLSDSPGRRNPLVRKPMFAARATQGL
jgi:hypothetical protein